MSHTMPDQRRRRRSDATIIDTTAPAASKMRAPAIVNSDPRDLNGDGVVTDAEIKEYARLSQAAYKRLQPVDGYAIDTDLSDRNSTTYVKDGRATVAYAGTRLSGASGARWRDLGQDALIALSLKGLSSRMQGAESTAKKAVAKYGRDKVSLTGHSAGSTAALYAHQRLGTEDGGVRTVGFNPGISPLDVKRSNYALDVAKHVLPTFGLPYSVAADRPMKLGKNAQIHAVKGDVVSSLAPYVESDKVTVHDKQTTIRDPHKLENFL
jgi:hypothetical protein